MAKKTMEQKARELCSKESRTKISSIYLCFDGEKYFHSHIWRKDAIAKYKNGNEIAV